MTVPQPNSLLPGPEETVLLVLLPVAPDGRPLPSGLTGGLDQLQQRLGPQVRVLRIDEARHPAVVRSFHAAALPACVLVRQGIELWRQSGLPDDEAGVALLLSKLTEPLAAQA